MTNRRLYLNNPGQRITGALEPETIQAVIGRGGNLKTNEESGKSALIAPQRSGLLTVYVGTMKDGSLVLAEYITMITSLQDAHRWAFGAIKK